MCGLDAKHHQVRLGWGNNAEGRLTHISTVERGLACNCTCPACDLPLSAKLGQIRRPHFAHADASACVHYHRLGTVIRNRLMRRAMRGLDTFLVPSIFPAHIRFAGIPRDGKPIRVARPIVVEKAQVADSTEYRNLGLDMVLTMQGGHELGIILSGKVSDRAAKALRAADIPTILYQCDDLDRMDVTEAAIAEALTTMQLPQSGTWVYSRVQDQHTLACHRKSEAIAAARRAKSAATSASTSSDTEDTQLQEIPARLAKSCGAPATVEEAKSADQKSTSQTMSYAERDAKLKALVSEVIEDRIDFQDAPSDLHLQLLNEAKVGGKARLESHRAVSQLIGAGGTLDEAAIELVMAGAADAIMFARKRIGR